MQRVLDAQRGGVVGAQDGVQLSAIGVVGAEDVLKTGLGSVSRPVGGRHNGLLGLAGGANQLARLQVRSQDAHCAVEEEVDVVVAGVAGDELDVEGAISIVQIQSITDELALLHTNQPVVKGGVVGDSVRVHDQAVIGDDGDTGFLGLCQHSAQGVAVDGSNDQNLAAIGDHGLDLRNLSGDVVGAEQQLDLIASLFQLGLHVRAVLIPALQILGGHGNADQLAFCLGGAAEQCAAGNDQSQSDDEGKNLLHVYASLKFMLQSQGTITT